MSCPSRLFVTAYLEGLIYSLVGVCPLCQTALECLLRKLLHPFEHPLVSKLDVLMMGIGEGDQITDGNWDA